MWFFFLCVHMDCVKLVKTIYMLVWMNVLVWNWVIAPGAFTLHKAEFTEKTVKPYLGHCQELMNEVSGGVTPVLFPWVQLAPLETFYSWFQNMQSFLLNICGLIAFTGLLKCFPVNQEYVQYYMSLIEVETVVCWHVNIHSPINFKN